MLCNTQKLLILALLGCCIFQVGNCKKADPENKPKWAKKDIRDFDDADLERLYDQWEVSSYHTLIQSMQFSIFKHVSY